MTAKRKKRAEPKTDKARGLYRKYTVERADGSSKPGRKHAECEYFVIDLTHDKYASAAMYAYADACELEYPTLAKDLRRRAGQASRLRASQ